MIARVWASRVGKSNLKAYLKHFSKNVLPDLRRYDGFASALVITRDLDGETELVVNTFWKNLAAIKAFAGQIARLQWWSRKRPHCSQLRQARKALRRRRRR
jgi:heme-degrading monooxygenase HmoA